MNRYFFQDNARRRLFGRLSHELHGRVWNLMLHLEPDGIPCVVRYVREHKVDCTHVDAELPVGYPIAVRVKRRDRLDERAIARGALVVVELGDEVFDRAFAVEVAPADVMKLLLDDRVRRYLMAHESAQLTTEKVTGLERHARDAGGPVGAAARPVLRLELLGWVESTKAVREALDVVAGIVARLRDAFAAVAGELDQRDDGAPFRPLPTDDAQQAAAAARAAEVARVARQRRRRELRTKAISFAIAAAALGAAYLFGG
jgi:hypothetical protein